MTGRIEDMLMDPSRRPRPADTGDLHERIMAGLEGEPGGERVGGRRRLVAGGAVVTVLACALTLVVVVGPAPESAPEPVPAWPRVRTEGFSTVPAAMTSPLEREAELLKSDAKAMIEGLRSRLPSL